MEKKDNARLRATKNYQNKFYRPSVLIEKDMKEVIESRFCAIGCKSWNEYINRLIELDMKHN